MRKRRIKNKINYNQLSPVEVYKLVLTGKIRKFPDGFWINSDAVENAAEITRYLLESILDWSPEDIKEKINNKVFFNNKLSGMLNKVFKNSHWQAINAVYPNKFKEWELKMVPMGFWNNETGIRAIKWLIEEKLKWTENDIKEKITRKVFYNNGLGGMLETLYNGSTWQTINAAFPGQFKEWELSSAPNGFWNQETAIRATKWLIEEKLKWTELEVKEWLRVQTFIDHGLSIVINEIYKKSCFKAINAAYPGRYQEKDFRRGRKYKKYPFYNGYQYKDLDCKKD